MKLLDITNKQSGVIVFENGVVLATEWSDKKGLPGIFPIFNAMLWDQDASFEIISSKNTKCCSKFLPSVTEFLFMSQEQLASLNSKGVVFEIFVNSSIAEGNILVICPDSWR